MPRSPHARWSSRTDAAGSFNGKEYKGNMKSIEQEEAAYAAGEDRPLRAFAGLMAAYAGAVAAGALLVRHRVDASLLHESPEQGGGAMTFDAN